MLIWIAIATLGFTVLVQMATILFLGGRLYERVANLRVDLDAVDAAVAREASADTPMLLKLNTLEGDMRHVLQDLAELKGRSYAGHPA